MHFIRGLDPDDPLAKSLKATRKLLTKLVLLLGATLAFVLLIGVPHLQTTYRYVGSSRRFVPPEHRQKLSADYIGPFGWQKVDRSDSAGQLTAIEFLPLHACIDFQQYEPVFPFWLLPKEYLDGRPSR